MAILSIDFEKAFDRVSHFYLFKVLGKMSIPEGFLLSLKAFYDNCTSKILVNGFKTQDVLLNSGVKQGCPLSPLLFICALEPLLCMLRRDKQVRGVPLPGGGGLEAKVVGYMDDVAVLCRDALSLQKTLKQIQYFCCASSFKVNFSKSNILNIGGMVLRDIPVPESETVQILGVSFDESNNGFKSWDLVAQKVNKKICMWNLRKLTMEGKVLITKMVILPILLYLSMVFPPPDRVLKNITKTCFTFLWSSRMEKLRREYVVKPKHMGGKDFPDFKAFLLVKYFSMCFSTLFKENPWSYFVRFNTGYFMRKNGWFSTVLTSPYAFNLPEQYKILEKIVVLYDLKRKSVQELKNNKKLLKDIKENGLAAPISNFNENKCIEIWKMTNINYLFNSQKDLAWSCVHECLPCRAFQHRRGLANSAVCPRGGCQEEETAQHLIWTCFLAQHVWTKMLPLIKKISGIKDRNVAAVTYGCLECPTRTHKIMAWKTINCVKAALWKARNILLFKHDVLTVKDILSICFSEMYQYYLLDKKHYPLLTRKWFLSEWSSVI